MAKKKTEKKETNQVLDRKNQKIRNEVAAYSRDMQVDMLDKMLSEFPAYLDERSKEFSKELAEYIDNHSESGSYLPEDATRIPLLQITQHAFKPVIKVAGISPKYSADQLAIAFDYFAQCTLKLNEYYIYIPKIADFCRMLNISTNKFKDYKTTSSSEEMREICYMIEDFCSSIVDDAAFNSRIEKTYAIFHQKFSNSRRDNDPVVNNNFVQNNNIMSEKEMADVMKKYIND